MARTDQRPAAGAAAGGQECPPYSFVSFYCSAATTDGCRLVGDSSI